MTTAITFLGIHVAGWFSQKNVTGMRSSPIKDEEWAELDDGTIPEGTQHLINQGQVGQQKFRLASGVRYWLSVAKEIVYRQVTYDLTAAQGRIARWRLPERLAAVAGGACSIF